MKSFVSFLESGLTVETKVKPDSREDTFVSVSRPHIFEQRPGLFSESFQHHRELFRSSRPFGARV
jgi:hypothetical protein